MYGWFSRMGERDAKCRFVKPSDTCGWPSTVPSWMKVDATRAWHWSMRGALRLIALDLKLQEAAYCTEVPDEGENDEKSEEPLEPCGDSTTSTVARRSGT